MSERLSASMLLSTTDASVWAREFCAIAETLGHPNIDEGWMIGWFANAMAAQEMAMISQTQPADFRIPEQPSQSLPPESEGPDMAYEPTGFEDGDGFNQQVNVGGLAPAFPNGSTQE